MDDQDTPWHITAKTLSYIREKEVYVAEGDVVISNETQSLFAQKATYNTITGIAKVSGDVRLEIGEDVLTGEEGTFDLTNKTGKIINGNLFLAENHFYISGAVMEKVGEETYLIRDCRLTTCDGDNQAWAITGSEIDVTIEGYGQIKHAAFRVRDLPFLYVPYMIFPAKTKRQSGLLLPRVGYSTHNGVDIEVPFFWAVTDQTDATFYQRFMSKRGFMEGLEFRYIAGKDSRGIFLFDILSDKIGAKDMNDSDEMQFSPYPRTNRTRYWLRSRVDQDLSFGLKARLDMDFVSDQDYLKEFTGQLFGSEARLDPALESGRPLEEKRSPTRRSALRLSRDAEEYSLQAQTSYYQLPGDPLEDETAQPLAGLNFTLLPEQIMGLPMFLSLDSDYDYIWRDEGQKGHSLNLSPKLNFPFLLSSYLEFEPSLRYTYDAQWLDDSQEGDARQSKKAYEVQARLSANLERVYDLEWHNVKRLKHRIWPVLTYEYRSFQDENDYLPWFEPIEVEGSANRLVFALENYLDARLEGEKGAVSYRQWATLKLIQGYDIDEARRDDERWKKKEPFEPLTAVLTMNPLRDMDLDCTAQWDHYDHQLSTVGLSLELYFKRAGGIKDTVRVDYQYVRDNRKSLNLFLDINLAYGFSVGSSLEREMDMDHNISNSYWLEYLSQCWGVKVEAETEDEKTSVMVVFRLRGLGDIDSF